MHTLLDTEYERICREPSDINEHCPILKAHAETYPHITEFGVRYGVSTKAFLAGRPGKLVSYDLRRQINVSEFIALSPMTSFIFYEGDSLDVTIDPTDVLFIDTFHTGKQLFAELYRHHFKVRHRIIMHDTQTFGMVGEDGEDGLLYGIIRFLSRSPEWVRFEQYDNNNGLTILSRKE